LSNEQELYYTLWDLFKELEDFDYEIIVTDNSCIEGNIETIKYFIDKMAVYQNIKLFQYTEYQGTVPPWQFGISKATGQYLILIDGHVTVSKDYFKKQYKILKDSMIKDSTIKVLWSASCFNGYSGDKSNYYYFNKDILSLAFANYCDETEPLVSQMGCVIVEREFFLKIGMFGNCFLKYGGYGAEELMLALKTKMFGGRTFFNKDVFFHHSILSKGPGGKKLKLQNKAIAAYILDGYDYMIEVINNQPTDIINLLDEKGRQELIVEIPQLARKDRNLILTAPISYRELLKRYG